MTGRLHKPHRAHSRYLLHRAANRACCQTLTLYNALGCRRSCQTQARFVALPVATLLGASFPGCIGRQLPRLHWAPVAQAALGASCPGCIGRQLPRLHWAPVAQLQAASGASCPVSMPITLTGCTPSPALHAGRQLLGCKSGQAHRVSQAYTLVRMLAQEGRLCACAAFACS